MTGGDVDLEAARRSGGVNGQVVEEFISTGAVVAGRRTFEPAGGWGGDHHDGVPIWVFSRHEPGIDVSHEGLAAEQIELERTRILEGEGGVTHMHYRVRR